MGLMLCVSHGWCCLLRQSLGDTCCGGQGLHSVEGGLCVAPSSPTLCSSSSAPQADEAAGSKCLELAEAVLAAAHDVEDEMGSPHQPAPAESGEDAREAELGKEVPAAGEGSSAGRNGAVPVGAAGEREGRRGGAAVAEEQPADGGSAE